MLYIVVPCFLSKRKLLSQLLNTNLMEQQQTLAHIFTFFNIGVTTRSAVFSFTEERRVMCAGTDVVC